LDADRDIVNLATALAAVPVPIKPPLWILAMLLKVMLPEPMPPPLHNSPPVSTPPVEAPTVIESEELTAFSISELPMVMGT
jgi:hypothetical protein